MCPQIFFCRQFRTKSVFGCLNKVMNEFKNKKKLLPVSIILKIQKKKKEKKKEKGNIVLALPPKFGPSSHPFAQPAARAPQALLRPDRPHQPPSSQRYPPPSPRPSPSSSSARRRRRRRRRPSRR